MTGEAKAPCPTFTVGALVGAVGDHPVTMDRSRRGRVRRTGEGRRTAGALGSALLLPGTLRVTVRVSMGRALSMSEAVVGRGATFNRLLWEAWEDVCPPPAPRRY